MSDLPPEIWGAIAHFLPSTEIVKLMGVHRVFMEQALDGIYRELHMTKICPYFLHKLDMLRIPDYARRVRSLHLEPDLLHDEWQSDHEAEHDHEPEPASSQPVGLLQQLYSLFRRAPAPPEEKKPTRPTADDITDMLMEVVPYLVNVETLSLVRDTPTSLDTMYVDVLWRVVPMRLRSLKLSVHASLVAESFVPKHIHFPHLAALEIRFVADRPKVAASDIEIDVLSAFMNKHAATLEDLIIGSNEAWDIGRLYSALGDFPRLRAFEVAPHTVAQPAHIWGFVRRHADLVRELTYVTNRSSSADGIAEIVLPQLATLTLALKYIPYSGAWWTRASPFLSSAVGSLRALRIKDPLLQEELDSLLGAFTGERDALAELALSVHSVSADFLYRIAERVPRLSKLDLRVHDVLSAGMWPQTPNETFPFDEVEHPFAREMVRRFSDLPWPLKSVTLKRRGCCGDVYLWGLMKLFADAFPTVTSFADQGSTDIPDHVRARMHRHADGAGKAGCACGRAR